MSDIDLLKERIARRNYTVGVIGLGYVGLPLVLRFGEVGFRVLGFDVDQAKVKQLNDGDSYIQHVPADRVSGLVKTHRFEATADVERLHEADAVIICVPTPLTVHREPDLQYVEKTTDAVAAVLRRGQLICLESTTYPGTTDEVVLPRLLTRGLRVGEDFFLAFSPEREDPGNQQYGTSTIPKVVGGVTPACRDLACTLYAQAVERVGIDVWDVIEAAKTKPFGFQGFYPGPGLGGHCIPIDPFYLTWKAREYGQNTRFIELAGEVNTSMPDYVIHRITDALNAKCKSVNGSKVLVLGLAYKPNVDDDRESPVFKILELLEADGARVTTVDPLVDEFRSHDGRVY